MEPGTVVSTPRLLRAVLAAGLWILVLCSRSLAVEEVILSIADRQVRLEPDRWDAVEGRVHGVVALTRIPSPEDRERLRDLGVELHQYLPENAFFATVDAGRAAELLALPFVRSAEPFRPEWKGPPAVVGEPAARLWLRGDGRRQVVVHFFPDVPREAALALLADLRCEVVSDAWERDGRMVAALDLPQVPLLLARDEVRWIDTGRRPARAVNESAAAFHGVREAQDAPYGLDGSGVNVGIMDADVVQANHPDFGNRVTVVKTLGGADHFHATHVTGTILGSGATNSLAKGMAPGARSWNWTFAVDDPYLPKFTGIPQYGIDVDSNSWGIPIGWELFDYGWLYFTNTDQFGAYTSDVGDLDGLARDDGVLINFAAGNHWTDDGYDGYGYYYGYTGHWDINADTGAYSWHTGYHRPDGDAERYGNMEPTAVLKNGLSVGAVDDDGWTSLFSSIGPAKDGRLKPDVTAVGEDVLSTIPPSTHDSASGTSMATPVVTGIAALVIEAWNSSHSGADPRLDVLKGLLIHSTFDLGNPGPDYIYGFGAIDPRYAAARALLEDGSSAPFHRTGSLANGATAEYLVDVAAAGSDLRVTLCWTDFPGNPAALKALVNDLDLVLVSPTGSLHRPWILDPSNPSANATKGVNGLDNVEVALVAAAAAGTWKVRVSGSSVPAGPQPFAAWFTHPRKNAVPVANGGPDRLVVAPLPSGATVSLSGSGSTDANQDDVLSFRWDSDGDGDYYDAGGSQAGVAVDLSLPIGVHAVGLRVEDSFGAVSTDAVTVTVANRPPVASLGPSLVFRADDPEGGTATLDVSYCSDPQSKADIVGADWDLDGDGEFDDFAGLSVARRFPLGESAVGLRVTDTAGEADETTGTVTVVGPEFLLPLGGSFKGAIGSVTDVDSFFLAGVKGATASVVLKSKTSVRVEATAPSGAVLGAIDTFFTPSARAAWALPENGWYWLEARPGTGAEGPFSLSVKVRLPKQGAKAEVALDAGHAAEEWSLDLLEGATVSLKAKGAGTPVMELLGPGDAVVARVEGAGKLFAGPVGATGTYRLRLAAESVQGYATYRVAWKATQPKGRVRIRE